MFTAHRARPGSIKGELPRSLRSCFEIGVSGLIYGGTDSSPVLLRAEMSRIYNHLFLPKATAEEDTDFWSCSHCPEKVCGLQPSQGRPADSDGGENVQFWRPRGPGNAASSPSRALPASANVAPAQQPQSSLTWAFTRGINPRAPRLPGNQKPRDWSPAPVFTSPPGDCDA